MNKPTKKQILNALALMWEQYCPPDIGHMFMGAGEEAEEVLENCGILKKDGHIDWKKWREQKYDKNNKRLKD